MSGIYIHIPFCERKCIYCDFYSVDDGSGIDTFLDALVAEIQSTASLVRNRTIETIYIGGGTPSLLKPQQLEKIIKAITARFAVQKDSEITIEANPGTVTIEKLTGYRSLGVNRISLGIQSFHDDELLFLGRIHTVRQALESVAIAREAGFTNISIDIMTSLPGQTIHKLRHSLEKAIELDPEHISAYSLTIEKSTPLYRMVEMGKVSPVSTDVDADIYEFTMEYLEHHGFEHYEVSNYARPGFHSKHNSGYWNHTPYYGFGPSAHSFHESKRWWNLADVNAYSDCLLQGKSVIDGEENLGPKQLLEEAIFLGLRSGGLDLQRLSGHYGLIITEPVRSLIHRWIADGFGVQNEAGMRLTSRGFLVCDELCTQMIGLVTK
jgi:oxygen-independent coproporphyrinogen III oxidase